MSNCGPSFFPISNIIQGSGQFHGLCSKSFQSTQCFKLKNWKLISDSNQLNLHGFFISGVGVFFSRQDAGLLPAKPDSGNCLAFYCRAFKTFAPTIAEAVFAFLGGNRPLSLRSTGAIILT
jgi:hypothetical protein